MPVGILLDVGQSPVSLRSDVVSIDLDVSMDEAHAWDNDVTQFPVELGAPITDHIQPMPDKLKITGFISDSAISDKVLAQMAAQTGADGSAPLARTQTHFDLLRQLKEDRKLVTVYTSYHVYTDMALQSVNLPRSNQNGDALEFTMEFIHVRLVSTQTVDVPPGISAKSDKKEGGKGSATAKKTDVQAKGGNKEAKPVEKPKSVLAGIFKK